MEEAATGIADQKDDRVRPRSSFFRVLLIWVGLLGLGYWWFDRQQPPAPVCPPALQDVAGVRLLYRYECGRCHTVALPGMQGKLGPPLRGLSRRREYLEQSLIDPGRIVVKGYINVMPSFADLPEAERKELVDYLLTL